MYWIDRYECYVDGRPYIVNLIPADSPEWYYHIVCGVHYQQVLFISSKAPVAPAGVLPNDVRVIVLNDHDLVDCYQEFCNHAQGLGRLWPFLVWQNDCKYQTLPLIIHREHIRIVGEVQYEQTRHRDRLVYDDNKNWYIETHLGARTEFIGADAHAAIAYATMMIWSE